jgi:hypothetical protein
MTLKNLLSFVTSRERYQDPDQGLVLSRRLRDLLETTERERTSTPDQNVPTSEANIMFK